MGKNSRSSRPWCVNRIVFIVSLLIQPAFSTTIPTIAIPPYQVRNGKDIFSDNTPENVEYNDPSMHFATVDRKRTVVMNDGCARISLGALRLIVDHLNELGYGLTGMPTAFQGRFNGAKGVWHRSCSLEYATEDDWKVWIEINPSQRKFPQHDEDTDAYFDPLRFTFELLKWTADSTSSALNLAFIPILIDRGVDLDTLKSIAADQISSEEQEIQDAVQTPELLLQWIYRHFSIVDKRRAGGVSWNAAMPKSDVEKMVYFIQHGMSMKQYPFLAELYSRIVADYFSKVVQSMSIRMPQSTMVVGIADPFGVLEPGQIFLQFSSPLFDEDNQPVMSLDRKKVIIARHPSLIASDMQAFTAVWRPEFRDFYNVVIFSTKGAEPGAAKLQGGDYDGDTFWVCFFVLLTRFFTNAPVPLDRPTPDYFGITVDRRTVGEVMGQQGSVRALLHTSLMFRGEVQLLGQTTKFFERLAYVVQDLHDPGVQIMASMHHLLIDNTKNGYRYTDDDFKRFVSNEPLIKPKKLPGKTAYELGMETGIKISQGKLQLGSKSRGPHEHPVDTLFFEVIVPQLQAVWASLASRLTFDLCADSCFNTFVDEVTGSKLPILGMVMTELDQELGKIFEIWNYGMNKKDSAVCAETIEKCYLRFLEYQPQYPEHVKVKGWLESRLPGEPCTWLLIKAAKLYELVHTKPRTNFMFHMAGRQLAYLKAMSYEDAETMTAPVFAILKPGKVSGAAPRRTLTSSSVIGGLGIQEQDKSSIVKENSLDSIDDDDFYSTCPFMYDGDE
jgi:hypothetical protein